MTAAFWLSSAAAVLMTLLALSLGPEDDPLFLPIVVTYACGAVGVIGTIDIWRTRKPPEPPDDTDYRGCA